MENWLGVPTILKCGAVFLLSAFSVLGIEPTSDQNLVPPKVIETRIGQYQGNDTERETTLKSMFVDAGCQQLIEQPVKSVKQPNLICVMPGADETTIIVGAHFDHAERGSGVVDNWSGASLLPSLFQTLKDKPRKHTYVFIGFCAEERGEIGSLFYVKKLNQQQTRQIQAMVNLDTLGLGPTKVWASHADPALLRDLATVAREIGVPVTGVNVEAVGSTDSESFRDHHIPAITIHTLTQKNLPLLHSVHDQLKEINFSAYYENYRLISAYLGYLDDVTAVQAPTNAR
jgi:putative aminopeptidase FrvX